ncbi:MAG: hypothetical protein Kow0090_08010 [Myxococcota bacterium]
MTGFAEKEFVRYYKGDRRIRAHIEALHAAEPRADKFTGEIATAVAKITDCHCIIAKLSREIADLNRPPSPLNKDSLRAVREYREAIREILEHIGNIGADGKVSRPYLRLSLHGLSRRRSADVIIGTLKGKSCSPDVKERLLNMLSEGLKEIKGEDVKIESEGAFAGNVSLGYLRDGDGVIGYVGFGEGFNSIQLEISRELREFHRLELIFLLCRVIVEMSASLERRG